MGRFDTLVSEGIKRIFDEDKQTQDEFISVITEARKMDKKALEGTNAFFIPNDEYLANFCTGEIRDIQYDCYTFDGACKWSNYLVFPIYNVLDEIVAFGGFNPFQYAESHEPNGVKENYYQYSSGQLFKKGYYVYSPKGVQTKAMEEGYTFVTDGLFDTISLVYEGFNSLSLMSSTLTNEILCQLKLIDRVILVPDNDKAGIELASKLKKKLPRLEVFKPKHVKDVDEYLKSEFREEALNRLRLCKNGSLSYV